MTRVIVLGGGFGGLAGATALREGLADDDEVVLVARDENFAMGFAKLWDLAGQRPLAHGTRSLRELERRGIRFVHDEVVRIDPIARTVETGSGELGGDALLVALGSAPSPAHRALLEAPAAHDLYDPTALPAMRAALADIEHGRIVVSVLGGPFKCPPAPYEAALIVDGLLRERDVRDDVEVVVTTPQPMSLPAAGVDASRFVADRLGDHEVTLRSATRITAVDPDRKELTLSATPTAGGATDSATDSTERVPDEQLAYDVWLGVPADAPPPALAGSALTGASGWIEPDRHLLRTGHDRVYAVGDCTVIPTAKAQLPHAGVFAAAQGRIAAANIVADLHGGEHRRFDGHGYCFLELPGELVAFVAGDFYADPPEVSLASPDHDQFLRKQAYERDHLDAWFG